MANIKSAKKRIKVIDTKTLRNKMIKSQVKTSIKKLENSISLGKKEDAMEMLKNTISCINKACSKGIFHKNNAARKVSNLTKKVNTLA